MEPSARSPSASPFTHRDNAPDPVQKLWKTRRTGTLRRGGGARIAGRRSPGAPPCRPYQPRGYQLHRRHLRYQAGAAGRPGQRGLRRVIESTPGLLASPPATTLSSSGAATSGRTSSLPATQLVKIPAGIDQRQACQLAVNPPTALLLLTHFLKLEPGSWIAQNAANSAVGQALIQIAHAKGIKTINFVRRTSLIPQLEALEADAVFLDEKGSVATARERCGGSGHRARLQCGRRRQRPAADGRCSPPAAS